MFIKKKHSHMSEAKTERPQREPLVFQPWRTSDWVKIKDLGKGAHGSTFAAKHNDKNYVVKQMEKERLAIEESVVLDAISEEACRTHDFPCFAGLFRTSSTSSINSTKNKYFVATSGYDPDTVDLFDYIVALGPTIADHMSRREWSEALTTARVSKTIACNMIRAVLHLHSMGMAHRDIKLENMIINTHTLHVGLIDFESACFRDRGPVCNGESVRKGTPSRAPPEVHERDPLLKYDFDDWKRTDYFELGVALFMLLAKKHYPVSDFKYRTEYAPYPESLRLADMVFTSPTATNLTNLILDPVDPNVVQEAQDVMRLSGLDDLVYVMSFLLQPSSKYRDIPVPSHLCGGISASLPLFPEPLLPPFQRQESLYVYSPDENKRGNINQERRREFQINTARRRMERLSVTNEILHELIHRKP